MPFIRFRAVMKIVFPIIILLLFFVSFSNGANKNSADESSSNGNLVHRYSIKSGLIEYDISGRGSVKIKGKKSFFFKNYGALSIEEEQSITTRSGSETKTHTMKKLDNLTTYNVTIFNKAITRNTDYAAIPYFISGKSMSGSKKLQLIKQGGKKIGTDTVLGYTCNVWRTQKGRECLYKDQIPLWFEASIMGINKKIIAKNIVFNINIPNKKFDLPKFSITTLPSYLSMQEVIKRAEK